MGSTGVEGFGAWIREWRHDNRWTQERLAEALAYDVSYIAKIERGRRQPSRQFIARLAEVTHVPKDELTQRFRRPSPRVRLPVPAGPIIGRVEEVDQIADLLRASTRWVTLIGAPGIGKTRLALEVAWLLAEDFPQGACFVPLADVPHPDGVASAVADQLGLRERPGGGVEENLAQTLRHQGLLLILDNFEHLLPAGELVVRLLEQAPQLRVLATSRQALDLPGETRFRVPTLAFPDPKADVVERPEDYPAVEVFVNRARAARTDFVLTPANIGPVVEICARLDGLPLAINLTAAASRVFSPTDIARALRYRLELPSEVRDDGFGHPCLRAALDWSWELLEPSQRALLARLGVFAGSCTLEGIEAVCCAGEHGDVLEDLAALEGKSLVEVSHDGDGVSRFRTLETVRRYGLERLREEGAVDELEARHCAYYDQLVEAVAPKLTGGREQVQSFRLLSEEFANLILAFNWGLEWQPERALRIASGLWRFFTLRRISEGRAWIAAALARVPDPSLARVRALNGAAVLARQQGEFDAADALLDEAMEIAARLDAPGELAFAILNEGIVAEQRANYERAEDCFRRAEGLYEELDEPRGVGHCLNCLGVIALREDDRALAASRFLESLTRFRALNDRWSIAISATNLGWIAEMDEELDEARNWYEECRQIWEEVGDQHGLARSTADLGRVARRQNDPARASELLEHALHVFHRLGDPRMAAACLVELGAVAAQRRRRDLAARLFGAAEGVRESLGTPAWPDEQELEERVLADLRRGGGDAVVKRARTMGRAFSLEDAVALVESGTWPPVSRRWPA